MTHTSKQIISRLEETRAHWRAESQSDRAEDSFYRLACLSRVELLNDVLAWLPKELARVESDAIDEADRVDAILDLVA